MKKSSFLFMLPTLEFVIDKTLGMYKYYEILEALLPQEVEGYAIEEIQSCLSSEAFIKKVYPYMNSLLTTTNIGLIVTTLRIYSRLETP